MTLKIMRSKSPSPYAYLRQTDGWIDPDYSDLIATSGRIPGRDLREANLRWQHFEGQDLVGAYLREAALTGAYLSGADLRWADLTRADMRHADLEGADLRGANLDGATTNGAILENTLLPDGRTLLEFIEWMPKGLLVQGGVGSKAGLPAPGQHRL